MFERRVLEDRQDRLAVHAFNDKQRNVLEYRDNTRLTDQDRREACCTLRSVGSVAFSGLALVSEQPDATRDCCPGVSRSPTSATPR